jgi:hypothetical protein
VGRMPEAPSGLWHITCLLVPQGNLTLQAIKCK